MWASRISEVFIAQHAIDFRKGADSLIAECYAMELNPYQGDCVVFVHRSRKMLKVIGGDAHGVWVLLRRFEGGSLKEMFPFLADPSFVTTTPGELALLLEGATCEVKAKARPWKPPAQGDNPTVDVLPSQVYGKETRKIQKENFRKAPTRGFREGAAVGE